MCAGDPTFANHEDQFRVAAFDGDDVTFPILDGMLHVDDGLAISRDDPRIEGIAVVSLYVDKVRRQENWRKCVFGFGSVSESETEREKRYTKRSARIGHLFGKCNAGDGGGVSELFNAGAHQRKVPSLHFSDFATNQDLRVFLCLSL